MICFIRTADRPKIKSMKKAALKKGCLLLKLGVKIPLSFMLGGLNIYLKNGSNGISDLT
jgi:hypothetical protein